MSQSYPPELMRQPTRAIILAMIQEQGPISRVELAALLGLNPATITRITRDLIDNGFVQEKGEGETKGAGRKRILLSFNHGVRLVIGIHADSRQVTAVIANLADEMLNRRTALLAPLLTLPILIALIDELLEENPGYRQRLAALCLSVNAAFPIAPLVEGLQQHFQVPVTASNPITVTAVGEAEVGSMSEQPTFALFYLDTHSHSCVYLNGEIRTGQFGLSRDGRPLSLLLSDAGLVETYATICAQGVPSALNPASVRSRLIFEAARRDDPAAVQTLERIADELAFAVLWTAHALNITDIVLAGAWLRASDLLMPLLNQRLQHSASPVPRVTVASLGDEAPLIGAVRLAVRRADPV